MRKHTGLAALATLSALTLAACGNTDGRYFTDDGGKDLDTSLFDTNDHLSSPYVVGAKVTITTHGLGSTPTSYQLRSTAPQVLSVSSSTADGDQLVSVCDVLASGSATLQLVAPDGAIRREATVEARVADEARLYAHGRLRIGGFDESALAAARVTAPRLVVGGVSVFGIGYFEAGQRLYGAATPQVTVAADVTTKQRALNGLTALFVTPSVTGDRPLAIALGAATLASVTVTGVPDAEITSLTLEREAPTSPSDDQQVWVQARTADAMGREVFGAYSTFSLDGVAQQRQSGDGSTRPDGDLYRFHFGGGMRTLVAQHGTLSATTQVQAKDGWVSDTQYLGCSAVPGAQRTTGKGLYLIVAAMVGAVLVRRRRAVAVVARAA